MLVIICTLCFGSHNLLFITINKKGSPFLYNKKKKPRTSFLYNHLKRNHIHLFNTMKEKNSNCCLIAAVKRK